MLGGQGRAQGHHCRKTHLHPEEITPQKWGLLPNGKIPCWDLPYKEFPQLLACLPLTQRQRGEKRRKIIPLRKNPEFQHVTRIVLSYLVLSKKEKSVGLG